MLGGFSVMEDWSAIDSLHKQIIDLQQKLVERSEGRHRNKSALTAKYTFDDIIHISKAMSSVVAQCRQVARTDSSVMIYGETGTGKELFAQSIHNASRRADGHSLRSTARRFRKICLRACCSARRRRIHGRRAPRRLV